MKGSIETWNVIKLVNAMRTGYKINHHNNDVEMLGKIIFAFECYGFGAFSHRLSHDAAVHCNESNCFIKAFVFCLKICDPIFDASSLARSLFYLSRIIIIITNIEYKMRC